MMALGWATHMVLVWGDDRQAHRLCVCVCMFAWPMHKVFYCF